MNGKVCWGLAVLTLIGATVQAAEPGVVVIRGQSPSSEPAAAAPTYAEPMGPIIGSAPGYGEFSKHRKQDFKTFPQFHNNHFGYEGGYYAGPEGYYTSHGKKIYTTGQGHGHGDGDCPFCRAGKSGAPGCKQCKDKPTHYTTYGYKWPQNMVYPQYGAPAGAVQYPYYTFRGPSDFFMK